VLEADVIAHVRDISHPQNAEQAQDVETILASLGVPDTTRRIEVWNKIDRLPLEEREALMVQAARMPGVLALSAVTGEGVDGLLDAIAARAGDPRHDSDLVLPYGEGRRRAWLFEQGIVRSEAEAEDGYHLTVHWTDRQEAEFGRL